MNGAMRKVLYMNVKRDKPLLSRIFVKFDDPSASNSRKDHRFWRELNIVSQLLQKQNISLQVERQNS